MRGGARVTLPARVTPVVFGAAAVVIIVVVRVTGAAVVLMVVVVGAAVVPMVVVVGAAVVAGAVVVGAIQTGLLSPSSCPFTMLNHHFPFQTEHPVGAPG